MVKNTGLMRLVYACQYSWQGFQAALANEAAFRQEFIALILLSTLCFVLDVSAYERLAMIASLGLILIIEILNSAIECVVDRISGKRHLLAERAKDYGSLAVLLSLIIAATVWLTILLN